MLSGEWLLTLASSSNDWAREGLPLLSRGITGFWASGSVELSQTYKSQRRICLFNGSERKTVTNLHQLTAYTLWQAQKVSKTTEMLKATLSRDINRERFLTDINELLSKILSKAAEMYSHTKSLQPALAGNLLWELFKVAAPQNLHNGKSEPPFHCFKWISKPPYSAADLPCSLDAHHQALSLFQKQDSY